MNRHIFAAVICCLALPACAPQGASHLGNPLLLPVHAVSAGMSNAAYAARRRPVERYVAEHHQTLLAELTAPATPHLTEAMRLARVTPTTQPLLIKRLREDRHIYENDPEALVVALMVHGG